ncbi:MAG: DUF1934 domain-containing protein [Clostridia bacterium]|nr:DUF1934 domain-containing protein [Clostridia bacterium]
MEVLSENGPRPVRITMTVRQSLVTPLFGSDPGRAPSLFGPSGAGGGARDAWEAYRYVEEKTDPAGEEQEQAITPEQYPEALEYAIEDMIDRDSDGYGFPPEEDDPDDPGDPGDPDGGEDPADLPKTLDELLERIGELLRRDGEGGDPAYDDDDLIARLTGEMEKRVLADGSLEITVSYDEMLPMEGVRTVISFNSHRPDVVSISRFGPISSMIVCEPGVRHVTAYRTPYAAFELAVVGRRCSTGVTYLHGGVLEVEYFVELRGTDMQYTKMKIEIEPLS